MTFDRMSTYITWGGRIGSSVSTAEIWQCGVRVALNPQTDGPGLPTPAELDNLFTSVLVPMHTNGPLSLSAGAYMEWAKAAPLDDTGHQVDDAVVTTTAISSVPGGAGSSSAASPQDACVVTFASGSRLGRANYGRIYLPWWSTSVDTATGRANVGSAPDVLEVWFNDFNAWCATTLSATAKIRLMSKLGSGTTKEITQIRIGDVKDTQRRRRNRIPESYVTKFV